MSYTSFVDDNEPRSQPSFEALSLEAATDAELRHKSRCARCCNFVFCRHNSTSMLAVIDAIFLGTIIWAFVDLIQAAKLKHATIPWWIYTVQVVPMALQVLIVLTRIRYVYLSASEARNIDWNLRQTTIPFAMTFTGLLVIAVFLFVAPICWSAAPTDTEQSFVTLWEFVGVRPSTIALIVTFVVSAFCNWRVAAKHRTRVRTFIAILHGRAESLQTQTTHAQTMTRELAFDTGTSSLNRVRPSAPSNFVPATTYDTPLHNKPLRGVTASSKKKSSLKKAAGTSRSHSALDHSRQSDDE